MKEIKGKRSYWQAHTNASLCLAYVKLLHKFDVILFLTVPGGCKAVIAMFI